MIRARNGAWCGENSESDPCALVPPDECATDCESQDDVTMLVEYIYMLRAPTGGAWAPLGPPSRGDPAELIRRIGQPRATARGCARAFT
jgi:hypothetical protein